jgi:hypothetical protein
MRNINTGWPLPRSTIRLEQRRDWKLQIESVPRRRGHPELPQASDELHLTHPAVTSDIWSLEESAGIALFDRIDQRATHAPV